MSYKDSQKKKDYELKHKKKVGVSRKEYQKEWKEKNKEKVKKDAREYYEKYRKISINPSKEKREELKRTNTQLLLEKQNTDVFNKNEKVCEFCGKIFVTKNAVRKFCSRSCCTRTSYQTIRKKGRTGGPFYFCSACGYYWELSFDPIVNFELFKNLTCPSCGFSKETQTYDSDFLYDDDIKITNKSLEELKNEEIEKIKEEDEKDLLEQIEASKVKVQQVTDRGLLDKENKRLETERRVIAKTELQKKKICILNDSVLKDDFDEGDQEIETEEEGYR